MLRGLWFACVTGLVVVPTTRPRRQLRRNAEPATAVAVNTALATVGVAVKQRILTPAGLAHAWGLGVILLGSFVGWQGYTTCVLYLVCGSAVTKVKKKDKEAAGIAEGRGGARGPENVWGSALTAALCAIVGSVVPSLQSLLAVAFVASLATKLSDTCASEIGKAYGKTTYLITTLKRVPRGTEGAVRFSSRRFMFFRSRSKAHLPAFWGPSSSPPTPALPASSVRPFSVVVTSSQRGGRPCPCASWPPSSRPPSRVIWARLSKAPCPSSRTRLSTSSTPPWAPPSVPRSPYLCSDLIIIRFCLGGALVLVFVLVVVVMIVVPAVVAVRIPGMHEALRAREDTHNTELTSTTAPSSLARYIIHSHITPQ